MIFSSGAQRGDDDDLASRFKNLQLSNQHKHKHNNKSGFNADSVTITVPDSSNSFSRVSELEAQSQSEAESQSPSPSPSPLPSPSLDDLLADLESELEDQDVISVNELNQARSLVDEANLALSSFRKEKEPSSPPPLAIPSLPGSSPSRRNSSKPAKSNQAEVSRPPNQPNQRNEDEEDEEAEAIEILSQILDDLPQPPPITTTTTTDPSAKLSSFHLPSPPRTPPRTVVTKSSSYSDAEIASWCAICCADAEVRCPGCAGELYCHSCWREGHQGEEAGWEERKHRWVGVGVGRGRGGIGMGGGEVR